MHRKLKPHYVVKTLKQKKITLFTPLEFRRVFDVSQDAAKWFIKTHVKGELFIKLRNGLYILADSPANHYLVANRLYTPSYISFDTALSFYGIIPETIYSITSATTRGTKEFCAMNIRFVYHKIKKQVYTGYKPINHRGNTILIAEPEKALADYLYFVALNRRGLHYERLDLGKIKKTKLLNYVKLFKRSKMNSLIKKIYVDFRKPRRIY